MVFDIHDGSVVSALYITITMFTWTYFLSPLYTPSSHPLHCPFDYPTALKMATIHLTHRRSLSSRHKKVDELVRMYSGIKEPSAPLSDVLRQPERASSLIYALGRQILLIKSRSLAFDDGQITLYDRALLVLSLDGKDLADLGALELFATEYLGGLTSAHDVALENTGIDVQYALDKGRLSSGT